MEIIFKVLCGILYLIGIALGYDYKEISVYICIYGCPIICIISAYIINVILIYKTTYKFNFYKIILWLISCFYIALNFTFFARICEHYNSNNLHYIFDQCVSDFQYLANSCNSTYEYCNIVIYVYLFFSIVLFNCGIGYICKKFL